MGTLFTPIVNGFWQATYNDQQGSSMPGMFVNAPDINLADAATVVASGGEMLDNMMCAGSFCVVNFLGITRSGDRQGVNNLSVTPFTGTTIPETSSLGVIVRTQQMRTNRFGLGALWDGDIATVIRTDRVGARIWVWVDQDNPPTIGARSGYVSEAIENNVISYLTTVPSGGIAIGGLIVHALDENCRITTNIGQQLIAGLIEFTTGATDYDRTYGLTI
jgi:hypothetical protein